MSEYAEGWFVVARSDEIQPGDVKQLNYFGTRMVIFRTESNKLNVWDAFCPHLGANLAKGGKVIGEEIQCPFHAWCFGPGGKCTSIPYAKKIPPKAFVKNWLTKEVDGLVFVWHAITNEEPTYNVPALPGHDTDQWQGWAVRLLQIKSNPWEIVENLADKAHFPIVHRAKIEFFENEFNGPIAIQRAKGRGLDDLVGQNTYFESVATYYGPSYLITEMDARPRHRLLLAHTPVDEKRIDIRIGVSIQKRGNEEWLKEMETLVVDSIFRAVEEDVAIWRHKKYLDRPILADGDGPIAKLRKWYKTFYSVPPT